VGYADIDAVKRMLQAESGTTWTADNEARLNAIDAAVSLLLEEKTGRTFGTGSTPETITVYGLGFDRLTLPKPLRSITSVTTGGTWNGSAYASGTLLTTTQYRRGPLGMRGEAYVLDRADGSFWPLNEPVVIVGTWADTDSDGDVPDDVTYAVNYLVAERFKVENAGPAGLIGPDGYVQPIRDAWKDPMVAATIRKYRARVVAV
jgi:hypothetical protein